MSCFWDSILSSLTLEDINSKLLSNYSLFSKPDNRSTILIIKEAISVVPQNTLRLSVLWNGEMLSFKVVEELYTWIKEYDEAKIGGGHDCSSCDPFLFVISFIFDVNIIHTGSYSTTEYKNIKGGATRTLRFYSDNGHFWAA